MALPTPKIVYRGVTFTITSGSNDKIDFEETAAANLAATLTAGTYTIGGIQAEIKRALEAAGDSTYTVVYNLSGASINKFTITSDGSGGGGILNLEWATGPNTATSAKTTLGFSNADDTGALTYTSDTACPASTTLTFDEDIRGPKWNIKRAGAEAISGSGVKQVTTQRLDVTYTFKVRFCTRATFDSFLTFMQTCALYGGQFDFYPKSSSGTFVNFTMANDAFQGGEMPAVFQHYEFELQLREVLPEETINTPGGRGSRATSVLTNRIQWM